MAVGDILEAVLTFQNVMNLDRYVNVLHWIVNTDEVGASNEESVASVLNAAVNATIKAQLSTNLNFEQTLVQRVFPLPRTTGFYFGNGGANVGSNATQMLPPSCALINRKRTAFAGRKFRGRVFTVGLCEDDQNNGVWSSARVNNISTAWETILTTLMVGVLGTGEYSPVIWPKNGTASGDATVITTIQLDTIVRSQRRREPGRGS